MAHEHRTNQRSGNVIAFCGTRGLPANYGGFETAVDEISRRMVAGGWPCEVFGRLSNVVEPLARYEGRDLEYVRGSKRRSLDTFVASLETGWRLFRDPNRYAHVFWFNNANLPGILLTRLARIPMAVNTDGLEWRRAKWSWPFKAYYYASSFLVARLCRTVISDSSAIRVFYRRRFFKETTFIPYGTPELPTVSAERERAILSEFGLVRGRYFLQITRFEPDNLPAAIAAAFQASRLHDDGYAMLFVGYQEPTAYARRLKQLDGQQGVRVRPAVYDPEVLLALRRNCYCYVHGNSVGGTNPALLEAMATCARVMAIDCEFTREVLGDTGWFFSRRNAATTFRDSLSFRDRRVDMTTRVADYYQWAAVASCYARLAEGWPSVAYDEVLAGRPAPAVAEPAPPLRAPPCRRDRLP